MLGDIALANAEPGRGFDEDDLETTPPLADRCALALDNAWLFADRNNIGPDLP